ncbi:MAG TPA: GDSL-type esterase/lipase family protein [Ohtaekwangia sp.]
MKKLHLILFTFIFFAVTAFMPQQKKRIIFFGDSITQAGVQPGGYITRMNDILTKEAASEKYELIGSGIGGNKVYDLYLRLEDDVLSKKPDMVVIYIGVNDVWHKRTHGTGTDLDKFEKFYNALIKKIQAQNIKVILCTPAVVGERTDATNELDGDLNNYSNTIRKIAKASNLPLVDLRQAFMDYNKKNNPENKESGILTSDRVHLNDTGNQFVAEEMWKVIKSTI